MSAAKTHDQLSSRAGFREWLGEQIAAGVRDGLVAEKDGIARVVYPDSKLCDVKVLRRLHDAAELLDDLLDLDVAQQIALQALGVQVADLPVVQAMALSGMHRLTAAARAGSQPACRTAKNLVDLYTREAQERGGAAPTSVWFAVIESILALHGMAEPEMLVDTILSQMPADAPAGLLRASKSNRTAAIDLLRRITIGERAGGRPRLDAADRGPDRQGDRFTRYGAARAFAAAFGAENLVPSKPSEAKRRGKRG